MDIPPREALRALLRRVEEVRGLSESSGAQTALEPGDPDALLRTLGGLVEELERSHRRLIETHIQLVSLREVASSIVSAQDAAEATRTVTRYLSRAFGFDDVFLLLVDRETRRLEGVWTHRGDGREQSFDLALPLPGDAGGATRALWLQRTVVTLSPARHPVLTLPDGHPLQDLLTGLGPVVCVPLPRSHSVSTHGESADGCGASCILGDPALLAPPPGPAAERWAAEREDRQRHCLGCEIAPLLGVIGTSRRTGPPPGGAPGEARSGDVELLESIALSVAPMIENARLHHDLKRSERFREHVLDSMPSALVAVSMAGAVLTFNRTAEELLGWSAAEVLGRPFGELFGEGGEELLTATLEHGRTVRREETLLRRKDGNVLPVSLTTSLLRQDRQTVFGAIATFVDLTRIKQVEEQGRRLDRLAALGRFTSSVAHEIRNPLAGIAAGVQYLARGLGPDPGQRDNMEFLQREVRRLDGILQNLFDITHPRNLAFADGAPEETVRRALRCAEPLAEARGITLALEVEPRTPPLAHDADQVEQVILNLVKNAIEASPQGASVRVRVGKAVPGAAAAPRRGPAVAVEVVDEGCGIPMEHQKTMFEPFFTTKQGGSGLGLYISHDIVKRHGGTIAVHSDPGQGTTFVVELPLENSGGTA